VQLEHRTLEVLHPVLPSVQRGHFHEFVADGEALLGQAAILLPVLEEPAAYGLTRLFEGTAPGLRFNFNAVGRLEQGGQKQTQHGYGRRS
jgi:hypothetical protein